ncbi:MAG: hypothetical protein DMF99_20545 [Acidobacteria bacterium]|nr:MAG: hypothetical protein DMF99_20545 [Acidobacteriota bacterium]
MAVRTIATVVLAASMTIVALRESALLVTPILVSVLAAYALEPAVELFMRAGLSRIAGAAVVYLLLAVAAGSLARTTVDQSVFDHVRRAAGELATVASKPPPGVTSVEPVKRRFDLRAYLMNAPYGIASIGGRIVVVTLLTFLLLAGGDSYKRKLIALGGSQADERRVTLDVLHTIDRQIERYLLARLLISVIVAGATAAGLSYVGVSHAVVWGALAGAFNVLPLIGPTAAIVLITLAALLQFRELAPTAAAGAIATAVAVIEGNLVTPWLTGRAGELNTVAIFVSVLFWGWLWGIWGLLLAVPIMVSIKAAADRIEALQPLGELLGR